MTGAVMRTFISRASSCRSIGSALAATSRCALPAIDGAWNSPGLAAALGIVRGRTCAALKITAVPLDMIMPVMGGEEALRELRATSPLTPVIGSSGHSKALTNFGDKGCRVSAKALCGAGFDGMLKTSGGKPRAIARRKKTGCGYVRLTRPL
jgi:CheY-like chemotaxis protein